MNNHPTINIFSQVISKVAKVYLRDFYELENLQSSPNGSDNYAKKSIAIVRGIFEYEFNKLYSNLPIKFLEDNIHTVSETESNSSPRILINVLDDFQNLTRSIPYFASSIIYQDIIRDQLTTSVCMLNSSFLGLTYYAIKGQGAWLEKVERGVYNSIRLRVATSSPSTKKLVFGINNFSYLYQHSFDHTLNNLNADIRLIGSDLITGAYVASGKFDAAILIDPNYIDLEAIKLLLSEAGGIVFSLKNKHQKVHIACGAIYYKQLFKAFNDI